MTESDESGDGNQRAVDGVEQLDLHGAIMAEPLLRALRELEDLVAKCSGDTDRDKLAGLRNLVMHVQDRIGSLRDRIDEKFVDSIEKCGPFDIGNLRYVVKQVRHGRCTNKLIATESVLELVGGDVERFCDYLVSQPFKVGSIRNILAAQAFNNCFEYVEHTDLEGKPTRQLVKVDTRF